CGAPPAMAQLVGTDPGRLRFLWCGRCGTHWRYLRTGCPFCEKEANRQLTVIAVEGEDGLRIDHCEACGAYLKTYNGEGSESVLLADWTSIHLDIVALDRGLKRLALSLYEL
ncbi:MAG TPA: formate dehydrogenase accessory protein FdhE, partial [Candidatus Sulfotelmatobacter sp.]